MQKPYTVAVLTISDRCSKGQREDESGKIIQDLIKTLPGEVIKYEVIPDHYTSRSVLQSPLQEWK